ncbi:4Fe-4S binding protein [Halopseudomonas sp.]|uniref:4Fe-4S binding protein n=1 Tax=Halopseudomonas sp. TaxID=2901191 RepID=UPI003002539F
MPACLSPALSALLMLTLWLLPSVGMANSAAPEQSMDQSVEQRVQQLFPSATRILPKQGEPPVYQAFQLDQLLGYAFLSTDYSSLQGFSGKPIRLLIGMTPAGKLTGVKVLEHHEPVFLHGLGEQSLFDFTDQYAGLNLATPIVVGSTHGNPVDGDTLSYIDGVSKATVSVVILNESVLQSAMTVARALLADFAQGPQAVAKPDLYQPLDWQQLLDRGYVQHWTLSAAAVEQQLGHSLALYPGLQDPDADTFSELYFAYLNAPSIGRNLLGDAGFAQLQEELASNEQALLVMSRGSYTHIPADFIPATTASRINLLQHNKAIELHDMNFNNGAVLEQINTPEADLQATIFRIKTHAAFNPLEPAELQLNVSLRRNPLIEQQTAFTTPLTLDAKLFALQTPVAAAKPTPVWLRMWQDRAWQVVLLVVSLIMLCVVFVKQRQVSEHSRAFHLFRGGFLLFTLFFIGFYAQGQLSVVNIFTLLLALWHGFDLTVFLMDPVIFCLWVFTFASLFIWGRGLFCGWLCPFGALQEMVGWLAKRLKLRQWKISERAHQRLQWLKYLILITLVPSAFYSLTLAERLAEIEPFKTSITLVFVRSWPFVLYAVLLLGIGLFVHKFYCRYLCPLGAGLAVLGRLRLFSWLTRVDACGKPCQHCHNQCEIRAIKRSGEIDYDECIQCLECIVILNNEDQCVASISASKQAAKAQKAAAGQIIVSDWAPSR